jgi:transposase
VARFVAEGPAGLEDRSSRPRRLRDRLRLTRVWDLLVQEGYDGSYDSVRRYAAGWRRETKTAPGDIGMAFVPLMFAPGEALQFDFSHEDVEIAGQPMRVKAAHVRLCASRAVYVRVYPRETQEMVFDAHQRAFAFFGGVPPSVCRRHRRARRQPWPHPLSAHRRVPAGRPWH